MAIKTVDTDLLAKQTGNLYKSVAIISKRARQISSNIKAELDEKLQYFEGFENELDDARLSDEQARISIEYERKTKPQEQAIEEMFSHEVYHKDPEAQDNPYGIF